MNTVSPRVFVSSVVQDFQKYRAAAAAGIRAAGAEPILVNEDFPAVADSSRNACLDAVASADAFVLVIGERGGWEAPSGRLVTEEEYDEAIRRGLPIYVFLQSTSRDAQAQRFEERVSDYVLGAFRKSFRTPDELRGAVTHALQSLPNSQGRMVGSQLAQALTSRTNHSHLPVLRLAIASVRDEELVDPLRFHSNDFQDELIQVASEKPYPLFGLRKEKAVDVEADSLIVTQLDERSPRGRWQSRLVIACSGIVTAETSIGNRNAVGSYDFSAAAVALSNDVEHAANAVFQAVDRLLALIDPFLRHRQLEYNVAILNLGYRYILDDVPKGSGIPVRMAGDEPVIAFDKPRPITRETLHNPVSEVDRTVQMLKHRAK